MAEPHRRDGEAGAYDAPRQPTKEEKTEGEGEEEEALLLAQDAADETGEEAPPSST